MTNPVSAPGAARYLARAADPAATTRLAIDHARFAAHARALIDAGCGGVTPFGTTGEGPSFSVGERRDAVDALIAGGVPAATILVSVSCAALPDTIALARHAQDVGAWGVLLMPPFFFKGVSDAGIVDSYRQVIDAVADRPLRVVLYHIPQVAGGAAVARRDRRADAPLPAATSSRSRTAPATAHIRWRWPRPSCRRWACTSATSSTCPHWPRAAAAAPSAGWPTSCPVPCTVWPAEPDAARTADDHARVERLLAWLGAMR